MRKEASITYEYGKNLYINMTNQCSCRCYFCLRDNSDGSLYANNLWYDGDEPSKEEILESLLSRDLDSYEEIVFCGYGEPSCRWDEMMWLCDELKKKGDYFIRINTNGQSDLINGRETAGDLKGRADSISISLNASTPEKYHEICDSDYGLDALPAIIKFTSDCIKVIPNVTMTVVSTMGDEEIEKCREICEGIGARFHIREYIEA